MTGPVTEMKHKERLKLLQCCRAKLQHLRANNSAGSTEVRTAENLYESALIAARWDGCPTVTGTDLPLSENNFFRAVFHADGINVLVVFYRGDEKIGRPLNIQRRGSNRTRPPNHNDTNVRRMFLSHIDVCPLLFGNCSDGIWEKITADPSSAHPTPICREPIVTLSPLTRVSKLYKF